MTDDLTRLQPAAPFAANAPRLAAALPASIAVPDDAAPMLARARRQERPSRRRAYMWRAVQRLAGALPMPRVALTRLDITLPHLPGELDGLRVLHLSDTHLSAGPQPADALPALLAEHPFDLAVWTGDIAEDAAGRAVLARLLRALRPRLGAFAVLGNHDHFYYHHAAGVGPQRNDVAPLVCTLEDGGARVLMNESALVGGALHVIGVDDPSIGRDRVAQAVRAVPAGAPNLLLAHSPDVLLRLGPLRPGLVLSGHTHGGQLRLPGVGPLGSVSALPRRYAMGLYRYAGVQTFVSRGVGTSGAAIRLYCPPEATLITLRAPACADVPLRLAA